MENLLKKLNLSERAISIYNECLGNPPLTHNEILSLTPNLSYDEFNSILNELSNNNLFVQIKPQNQENISYYFALPPFSSVLTLYSNIDGKVSSLQEQIVNILNQIFEEKNKSELDEGYNKFLELKKEYSNIILVQKQNYEENLKELEKIKEIKTILYNLNEILLSKKQLLYEHQQRIKGITQAQFGNLVKILSSIRTQLEIKIKDMEYKTIGEEILTIIEKVFSNEFQRMVEEFTDTIYKLLDLEFDKLKEQMNELVEEPIKQKIEEPIKTIIEESAELQNTFQELYTNLVNSLEIKVGKIEQIVLANKDSFINNMQNLEQLTNENLNKIVQDLINQISEVIKPIENVIEQFLEKNPYSNKMNINNIWIINSRAKINEEIINLINNSKEEIVLILPKIEGYLKKEQVQSLPENLKIKIATSDSHTDNIINEFMQIKNIEFRTLTNENTIALKGDQDHIIFGLLQKNSENPLNDIIGIGSNFNPFIEIFSPLIETTWSVAKAPPKPEPEVIPEPQPVAQLGEILISKVEPKSGDSIGNQINTAFNKLIEKLKKLQGYEFANELQKISDLVFEKVGFSSTLHRMTQLISIYKPRYTDIDENDRAQIFTSIETIKQEIFAKTGMHL